MGSSIKTVSVMSTARTCSLNGCLTEGDTRQIVQILSGENASDSDSSHEDITIEDLYSYRHDVTSDDETQASVSALS